MLDIRHIEKHYDQVKQKLRSRCIQGIDRVLEEVLVINQQRRQQQHLTDSLRSQCNEYTQQIAAAIQKKDDQAIALLKQKMSEKKTAYQSTLKKLKKNEKTLKELLISLPNLPDEEVPVGKDATDNQVIFTWEGHKKRNLAEEEIDVGFVEERTPGSENTINNQVLYTWEGYTKTYTPKAHWDIVKEYDIVDFSLGSTITGAGFPIYKNKGAQLQRALVRFFLEKAIRAGYEEMSVPLIVNKDAALGTGQLPDKEGMMYGLQEKGLYLIPTAEIPLTNLYQNRLLTPKDLPIKMVGHTPCFRREAGSWGRHVRGLNRLHQFDKVEIVQIVMPGQARDALQDMCNHVGRLLKQLGLTYRILKLCTGDLGRTSAITYDFEVWSSGQQQWLEVSSVSNFKDYQAQRIHLRYEKQKKKEYCYTLNGSALALPRVMAALIENYQEHDHIGIPALLYPYTMFDKIMRPKK